MNKERFTSQKKIILDIIKNSKKHFTAQEVYYEAKKYLPRIGKATVYRILKKFTQKKIIKEIPLKVALYDKDVSPHAHFVCQRCGKVFDVFEKGDFCVNNLDIGEVISTEVIFYGICNDCKH